MMQFRNFENGIVNECIANSKSLTEVCKKLGISTGGTSTTGLRRYIEDNNIDISHFTIKKPLMTQEGYEQNPKYCKTCGKLLPWEKRRNDFCNSSCAASFNNKAPRKRQLSFLDQISDEDFINIISNSNSWSEIFTRLGYSKGGSKVRKNIEERIATLNIQLTIKESKKDWSQVTKGELFNYSKNWQSARTTIRRGAQKAYEEANKPYKCAVCGYDKHVEIAHIKAVSDFSDDATITEINDSNNLIGLCPNHHWEYDNGLLDLNDYVIS